MQYQSDIYIKSKSIVNFSIYLAVGLLLHFVEFLIPKPLPWMRLGLHNVLLLMIIYTSVFNEAFLFALLRPVLSSIFTGTFLSSIFFLGFISSMMSFFIMFFAYKVLRKSFSIIGISVIGAVAHNIAQLFYVYFFWIEDSSLLKLLPVLILLGIANGLVTGFLAYALIEKRLSGALN